MTDSKYCITMEDIYQARERIKDHAIVTPLIHSDNIASLCGCNMNFKLETLQRCKAFKFRGALNKLKTIPQGSTVVAVSAGNHSQGVALAAQLTGNKATIYMPENAPSAKVQATQHYGGNVIQQGRTFDDAKNAMMAALNDHPEWTFVSPYNDPHIIAGTGTIGVEIFEQMKDVDTVVVPIGGGGLISGVSYALKHLNPNVRIIGVNMASCPSTYKIFNEAKGRKTDEIGVETLTPLADGIAVKSPGELNLAIIHDMVDEVVVVNEDEVATAVALLAERAKVISEGAGATPLASVLARKFSFRPDEKIVCIVSGGNIQLRMLSRCIDRALFLRRARVSVHVVLPYGTIHFASLIQILANNHAEIVSCNSSPHVDTVANKEQYLVIIDIDHEDNLNTIARTCHEKGWEFIVQGTETICNKLKLA